MIAHRRIEINSALEFFKNALNCFLTGPISCFEEIKQTKNSLGAIYRMFGEPMLALQTYFESISISEKYNFRNSVAYNNIGVLYFSMAKHEKALRYFKSFRKHCHNLFSDG
jgi:tetratricopeptide (TPR) repeat protein